jgi:3-isopropylmalate/(R)-2-methylmalate dehydratase small subunit
MIIKGRVWKFGNDINTDLMMPASARYGKVPEGQAKFSCLSAIRPEFSRNIKPGDIIICGKHCGAGSSRPAPRLFMELKAGCIIADSFGPIFFRNAIAIGFPAIELPGVSKKFQDGEKAEIVLKKGIIRNLSSGDVIHFDPYPKIIQELFVLGGVKGLLKKQYKSD